jgi:hypothetical protein
VQKGDFTAKTGLNAKETLIFQGVLTGRAKTPPVV